MFIKAMPHSKNRLQNLKVPFETTSSKNSKLRKKTKVGDCFKVELIYNSNHYYLVRNAFM